MQAHAEALSPLVCAGVEGRRDVRAVGKREIAPDAYPPYNHRGRRSGRLARIL
jgi:hypothetical protein